MLNPLRIKVFEIMSVTFYKSLKKFIFYQLYKGLKINESVLKRNLLSVIVKYTIKKKFYKIIHAVINRKKKQKKFQL